MKKTFPATLDQLYWMLQFVQEHAKNAGFNDNVASKIEVAMEEALVNVIKYAYPEHTQGTIEIDCNSDSQRSTLEIVIRDSGGAFDPLKDAKPPSFNAPIDEKPIGGYGIFLIQQIMDSVNYQRDGNYNVLTLVKKEAKVPLNLS